MSDTPRTDEEACFPSSNDNSDAYSVEGTYVDADFARQLERELTAMTQRRDELLASLEKVVTLLSPAPSGD
jgi:hypothetical protein